MTLDDTTFQFVRQFLLQRAAISLDTGKQYLVRGRLAPLARRYGMNTVDELVARLRTEPNGLLADDVLDAMTTNETSFFRDRGPFDTLRDLVFPELFRARAATCQLTIWCAACSTGQEPYSIAMLLREHFSAYRSWSIRIISTDLSRTALARAQVARYTDVEVERGLSPQLRARYFRPEFGQWQLVEEIRRMVEFRPLNLAAPWPPLPVMDIVLLRNVMVYFRDATKQTMLGQIRAQLRPDGYLFLGSAETTILLDPAFVRLQHAGFSYYRLRNGHT